MSSWKLVAALVCGVVLSGMVACSGSDLTATDRFAPAPPLLDGGGWTGSGSRIEQDSSAAARSADPVQDALVDSASTGRGGGWTGSGS